jgi:flagellar protein FlaG
MIERGSSDRVSFLINKADVHAKLPRKSSDITHITHRRIQKMIDKVTGNVSQSFNEPQKITGEAVRIKVQERQQEETTTPKEPVTKEKLQNVVQGMNEFLSASNTHLKFEFHDRLKEYYVTIVDDVTREVVREIPAKKMLDMYAAMTEFVGLMVDKKV